MYVAVKFVKDKHAFFAEILYRSMKGLGTNNKKLIHTIVCRCEKDMENIKCQFQISYKKSLESFITVSKDSYFGFPLIYYSFNRPLFLHTWYV